jgi:hypothetical protein
MHNTGLLNQNCKSDFYGVEQAMIIDHSIRKKTIWKEEF